ncbi:15486_t:CDS:2, partial [Racocetra fulgida]
VNEQNIEDFFFEPDELPKVPEETKKIKQCLDIVRDEISTLRQQWNSASWVMTAIEWDRQRTMKSYNFGSRSLSHNFSRKSLLSNRSTSIRSSNRESDNSSMVKGKGSDTASQIETLRDTMYHAPDRAWNNIRLLGVNLPTSDINDFVFVKNKQSNSKQKKQPNKKTSKSQKMAASKPIPPILASYLSTLPSVSSKNRSSTSSSVDNQQINTVHATQHRSSTSSTVDNQQNNTVNTTQQLRKKSTIMKTLRLGKRSRQNSSDELTATFSQPTNKDNKLLDKDINSEGKKGEAITINILPPVIQPINTSGPITLLTPTFIESLKDHGDINSEVNQDVNDSKAIDDIIIESLDADGNDMKLMNDERKLHAIDEEIDALLKNDNDIENSPLNGEAITSVDRHVTNHNTLEANDIPSVVKKTSKSDDKCVSSEGVDDDKEKNTTGETNETNADTGEIDVKTATSNNLDLVTEDNVTNDITETNVPNSDDAVLDAMIDAIVDVNNVNTKHSESSADLEKLLPNDSPNDSSNDSSNNSQNDSNNLSNDSSHDSSNQLPNTLSNSNYTSGTVTSTNEKPLSLATSSTAQLHHPPSSPTADSTLDNSSQPNVPLESDSTSFPHSHVARSIPPTPTTPYFPATEGSTNLPEFPSEPISGMPEQSTPNFNPRSDPEFEPINPFLIPPMSTSTYISPATPLPSTPTTPQHSPLLQDSRP